MHFRIAPPALPGTYRHDPSCGKVGQWKIALQLLSQLRAGTITEDGKPLLPDTVSFNVTINALARVGEWEKALALLREMANAGGGVAVSAGKGQWCRVQILVDCYLIIGLRRSALRRSSSWWVVCLEVIAVSVPSAD